MDERAMLSHLLDVEKKADAIVAEAEAESLRTINENEHNCRIGYEKTYTVRYAALEDDYKKEIAALDAAYKSKLDEYRDSMKDMAQNRTAFNALAGRFLFQEE
jgi:hypothetical protein